MIKTAIVATTIYDPNFMECYLKNIKKFNREDDVTIIIIPDKKTPTTVLERSLRAKQQGFKVRCLSLEEQETFLKKLGLPLEFIPYNTDNRRNVGFLLALDEGCDVLISIDDDNYCLPEIDFVGEHLNVGTFPLVKKIETPDGWFNVCSMLDTDKSTETFPRGFPYGPRKIHREVHFGDDALSNKPVAVNVGLWRDDPDIDAISRLALGTKALSMKSESVLLGENVWTPINTQNTALTREAAKIYYYVRMGYPLTGMQIDRYGDILSGYFIQKCVKHLKQNIRIGSPVADHHRTPHNLFKDLYYELAGMVVIEELLPWLREVKISGSNYTETYASLADALEAQAPKFAGFVWDEGGREFLQETAKLMRVWLSAVKRIG